jgi:hypothetical protein
LPPVEVMATDNPWLHMPFLGHIEHLFKSFLTQNANSNSAKIERRKVDEKKR